MQELLKAGAKYVHMETEVATLQQQLEAAKSECLFVGLQLFRVESFCGFIDYVFAMCVQSQRLMRRRR